MIKDYQIVVRQIDPKEDRIPVNRMSLTTIEDKPGVLIGKFLYPGTDYALEVRKH